MEIKCEYCGGFFDDSKENCPHCNGINSNIKRVVDNTPKTIDELKKWYADRHLPPYEETRFFIGENHQGPRAFGIYRENTEVIVYKNKDDGTRAIRYQGTDEAYAVNELYLKLKAEILNQKALNQRNSGSNAKQNKKSSKKDRFGVIFTILSVIGVIGIIVADEIVGGLLPALLIAIVVAIVAGVVLAVIKIKKPWLYSLFAFIIVFIIAFIPLHKYNTPKYYNYDNTVYCNYKGNYYSYDGYDYSPISYDALPVPMTQNLPDYEYDWKGEEWDEQYNFKDSNYYEDVLNASSSSDSDSDYDWDSGSSWDSGGTDWSSDW